MKNTLRDFTLSVLERYFALRNTPGRTKKKTDWDSACTSEHVSGANLLYPDLAEFKSAVGKDRKNYKKEQDQIARAQKGKAKQSPALQQAIQGSLFSFSLPSFGERMMQV